MSHPLSDQDFAKLQELGKFTNQLKQKTKKLIQAGSRSSTIINFVELSIFEAGYLPAFPCTVCLNDVAAHKTIFLEDEPIQAGDVVKIDFGVSHQGVITDNAFTVEVDTKKHQRMLKANLQALNQQLDTIQVGTTMGELGRIIQNAAEENNFNPIHDLYGHQVEKYNLHAGVFVPCFDNHDKAPVSENMILAIEPYLTTGSKHISNGPSGHILELFNDRETKDPIANKVLEHILIHFSRLPFSRRWLVKDIAARINIPSPFSEEEVIHATRILSRNRNLHDHNTLMSPPGSVTSQFEETVAFHKGEKTIITRL